MDSVTVKEVARRPGVSRQTVYNHYYCPMDILRDVFTRELNERTKACSTYLTWVTGWETVLRCFAGRRTVVLHVYFSQSREELMRMIRAYGEALIGRGIDRCAQDKGIQVTAKDRAFMLSTYLHAFMGLIDQFFAGGITEDPAYLSSRCDAMMGRSIQKTLQRLYAQPE